MTFEWDEAKSRANRIKHGLDFAAALRFDWESALVADRTRHADGEPRFAALGILDAKLYTIVFTRRGRNVRIISMRRSNPKEEKAHESAKKKN